MKIEEIKKELEERMPEHIFQIEKVTKNNGVELTGITCTKKGSNVGATAYIDENECGDEVICRLLHVFKNAETDKIEKDIEKIYHFEDVRNCIVSQLINKEKNKKMLENVPHTDFLDLSTIYRIKIGQGCVTINNEMMKTWGVDEKAIKECAKKEEFRARDIKQVLSEMTGEEIDEIQAHTLVVIDGGMYGAMALTDEQTLGKVCSELNTEEIVILPSSIYEVIALPNENVCLNDLKEMVKEVSETQVAEEERLSDNIYIFNAQDKMYKCL